MTVTIIQGDCREVLKAMPAQSVNCCVTSPPYFGLRDYGTGQWEGGRADCRHVVGEMRRGLGLRDSAANTRGGAIKIAEAPDIMARALCPHCGAVRVDRQIGLEESPDDYVAALVDVFRDVRRVLRDDGTLWIVIGDSYAGSGRGGAPTRESSTLEGGNTSQEAAMVRRARGKGEIGATARGEAISGREALFGLKPKDLIGIPWMVAFALRGDGWYLRQDNIWHKPNPMPESVTDRCTKSHEYIFLLSKSERYYYDAEAITEPSIYAPGASFHAEREKGHAGGKWADGGGMGPDRRSFKAIRETRNKRSVWTVATKAYNEAHFATYPPDLIEPCILAGCPEGGAVLDPFGGAGTTGLVADRLKRNATLIELNPEYAAMAKARIANDAGMFAT